MTGLAAPWWGGHSPRATTLPPRRLRAALHPLRHPLEPRCARLEPRPIPLTHAPAAASILLTSYLPARTTLPPCLWACACAHFDPLPGRIRARAAVGVPGSESDVATRATLLWRRAYTPTFRMLPHATTPPHIPSPYTRSRLHVLTTHADMAGTRLALSVAQARQARGDAQVEVHEGQSSHSSSRLGGVDGWLGEQGWYPGGPRPAGRSCWVEPAVYRRLVAAGKPTVGCRT